METTPKNKDLAVVHAPWGDFIKAWVQKLFATAISAKVLITLLVIGVSYHLTTKEILTGDAWAGLMGTALTVFLGARITAPVLQVLGDGLARKFGLEAPEEDCND